MPATTSSRSLAERALEPAGARAAVLGVRNLIKSFNLGLAPAGIEKRDEHGRTVDLHALRHTLDTNLSKKAVAARRAS
jgi:hypothetical protein